MKHKLKSASNRIKWPIFLFFFLLAGCADTKWPTWLTGEPGEDVLNAPRVVMRPTPSNDSSWPALGEVSDDMPIFSDVRDMQEEAEYLRTEQMKAQVDAARIKNIPMPESVASSLGKDGHPIAAETSETRAKLEPYFALKP